MQPKADMGFIVVQIDGVGTTNRSKAFHDVCWKNLADSGNEQWMGWPVDASYSASSNVDNAWRLRGQLSLIVGEQDANVDPSSTMQVVNALIKADKTFDFLVVPGAGHSAGRNVGPVRYAMRRQFEFFRRHLQGRGSPDWNDRATTPPDHDR